jgi:Condensation domain
MTTEAFAASYLQESLYLTADNGESAVNVGVVLELHGPLDIARLLAAIDQVAHRHEALRTTLAAVDGDVRQVIAPSAEVPAVVLDLSAEHRPSAEAMRLIRGHLRQPFALDGPSLCRVMVVACAPETHFLALSLHHAIMDGWSVNVLAAELRACYRDAGAVPGAEPALQPADYAEWERQAARSAFVGDWQERLSGYSTRIRIPGATGPGPGQLSAARELPGEPAGGADGTYRLARRLRVPAAAVFAAGVAASLREYAAPGLIIGLVRANRERVELRDVVGYLADIAPLTIDLRGDPAFGCLVERAADSLAFSRERPVPLAALAHLLRADGEGGPLFDVCLNYRPDPAAAAFQGQHEQPGQTAGELRMTSINVPDDQPAAGRWWDGTALIDYVLRSDATGQVSGCVRGDLGTVAPALLGELADRFLAVLADGTASPGLTVSELATTVHGAAR